MKKWSIGIDLDDTLNTLVDDWLIPYNKDFSDNIQRKDIPTWDIASCVKCGEKIFDYLKTPGFFKNLGIQPYCQEVTKWLSDYADLYIVTAYIPETCVDKTEWVKSNLPHINHKNIIFTNNKGLIKTDYLIDDGGHNLEAFEGISLAFDQPWNKYLGYKYDRFYNWLDIKDYFEMYIED